MRPIAVTISPATRRGTSTSGADVKRAASGAAGSAPSSARTAAKKRRLEGKAGAAARAANEWAKLRHYVMDLDRGGGDRRTGDAFRRRDRRVQVAAR
jgi:hypothetical protein